MDNYLEYKLMGKVNKARMNANAVPHIFAWQPDRASPQGSGHTIENGTQTSIVDQLLNEHSRTLLSEQFHSSEIGIQCCDSKASSTNTRDACSQTNFKVHFRSKGIQVSLKDMKAAFLRQEAASSSIQLHVIRQPPVKRSRKQIFPPNIDNPSIEILYA